MRSNSHLAFLIIAGSLSLSGLIFEAGFGISSEDREDFIPQGFAMLIPFSAALIVLLWRKLFGPAAHWAQLLVAIGVSSLLPNLLPVEHGFYPLSTMMLLPIFAFCLSAAEPASEKDFAGAEDFLVGLGLVIWGLEAMRHVGLPLLLFAFAALIASTKGKAVGASVKSASIISLACILAIYWSSDYRQAALLELLRGPIPISALDALRSEGLLALESYFHPGRYHLAAVAIRHGGLAAALVVVVSMSLLVYALRRLLTVANTPLWARTVGIVCSTLLCGSAVLNVFANLVLPVNPGWGMPFFTPDMSLWMLEILLGCALFPSMPKLSRRRHLRLVAEGTESQTGIDRILRRSVLRR